MYTPAITGSGIFTPTQVITNAELVTAFNAYADLYNAQHAQQIEAGELPAKEHSSEEFIVKASGIEQRYVMNKTGILDPEVMHPLLRQRRDAMMTTATAIAMNLSVSWHCLAHVAADS